MIFNLMKRKGAGEICVAISTAFEFQKTKRQDSWFFLFLKAFDSLNIGSAHLQTIMTLHAINYKIQRTDLSVFFFKTQGFARHTTLQSKIMT